MDLGSRRRLGYPLARRLVVITGLAVLTATALVLLVRGVENIEVLGVVLFVPIYLALIVDGPRGGGLAALGASVAYAVLRSTTTDALTQQEQVTLVLSRSAAYLVFGLVGGAAVALLRSSLEKLDRTDLVDDATGLYNSRFAADELELELVRGRRYGSAFALLELSWPAEAFTSMGRRARSAALERLGDAVRDGLRSIDRPAVLRDGDLVCLVVLMPETPRDGAEVVAGRLDNAAAAALGPALGSAAVTVRTFPADAEDLATQGGRFARVEAEEYPEATTSGS